MSRKSDEVWRKKTSADKLEFYHNGQLQITHDFTQNANPYEEILHDTYSITSEGKGDTFRWDFARTDGGYWPNDDGGRTMYIANIAKVTDAYEYAPETPVFAKTGTLHLPETEHGRLVIYSMGISGDTPCRTATASPWATGFCSWRSPRMDISRWAAFGRKRLP